MSANPDATRMPRGMYCCTLYCIAIRSTASPPKGHRIATGSHAVSAGRDGGGAGAGGATSIGPTPCAASGGRTLPSRKSLGLGGSNRVHPICSARWTALTMRESVHPAFLRACILLLIGTMGASPVSGSRASRHTSVRTSRSSGGVLGRSAGGGGGSGIWEPRAAPVDPGRLPPAVVACALLAARMEVVPLDPEWGSIWCGGLAETAGGGAQVGVCTTLPA